MTIYHYSEIIGGNFHIISDTVEIKYNKIRGKLNVLASLQNENTLSSDYIKLFTNPSWIQPTSNLGIPYFMITLYVS